MAIVKITKIIGDGQLSLRVPARAYYKQYARNGWNLAADVSKQDKKSHKGKNTQYDTQTSDLDESDAINDDFDDDEDVEYVDPEDLKLKPIEELDFDELQILAEDEGIDISNLPEDEKKASKILREALKAGK